MAYTVHTLDAALRREIADFLATLPATSGASLEHDPRWLDVLRTGLGHRPMAVLARRSTLASPITGYLPLALVSSRLFGRFLVSLPYLNRAGAVAHDETTRAHLVHEAAALAARLDVRYVELRHGEQLMEHPRLTHARADKVLMRLDLPLDEAALWKSYDPKVRNAVRKGHRTGLTARFGGPDLLDDFYAVFAVNMRDLGTPVYPRALFAAIAERFPDEAEFAVVDFEGQPVAAALLLHDPARHTTHVPSASSLRAFSGTNANMALYHALLERAIARGSRVFDFGRSTPDSGTYRFKKQWGATPTPTTWQYHVRHGDIGAMRPDHPRMQKRIAAWQKLPLWAANLLGPAIVRGIP